MGKLRFAVLGPVRAWREGIELDLGPPQQRAMLAVLLASGGGPVNLTEVIDVLWGQYPPASAINIAQRYVGQLRRLLEPTLPARSEGHLLVRSGGGYRLLADESTLDVLAFRDLMRRAERAKRDERQADAVDLFVKALGLWHGPAGSGLEPEVQMRPPFVALDRERLSAVRLAADAALAAGLADSVLPLLQREAESYPLDESLQARLILVLAATGRRAAAFEAYQAIRRRLADDLGVDPGSELTAAHANVLRQDGGSTSGKDATVVPAQLPPDLLTFSGRRGQIAELLGVLPQSGSPGPYPAAVTTAIGGTAGVGKTTLAVHYAHQLASRFPDGQLYVNLRGFDAAGTVPPQEALRGFLEALGVPAQRQPADLDGLSALYRSRLAGLRVLILLDNAFDAAQVTPMLPGSADCFVIITSRNQLSSLVATHGAYPLTLDLLSSGEARDLLARRIGADRVAAEPEAVDEIIQRCTRLPLALATVAARAAIDRSLSLAAIAEELARTEGSLHGFAGPDSAIDIRAVFSWSYGWLGEDAARAFRLLALHPPMSDVDASAIAALMGVPAERARTAVGELTRANLILRPRPGRITFHDLLRAYATELLEAVESEPQRRIAGQRLLDHYLLGCFAAYRWSLPSNRQIQLEPPLPGVSPIEFVDLPEAMRWVTSEREALIKAVSAAAEHGYDDHCWRLAFCLSEFLDRHGYWDDWLAVSRIGLEAAQRVGDAKAEALSHMRYGDAASRKHMSREAWTHLSRASELFAELGDVYSRGVVLRRLAWQLELDGAPLAERLDYAEQALALHQAAGDRTSEANTLNQIGWHLQRAGDYAGSLDYARRSLDLLRKADLPGHRRGESAALDTLAGAYFHLARYDEAMAAYLEAIAIRREEGDRYPEASSLRRLAGLHDKLGDPASAQAALSRALAILEDLGHPDADEVRAKLAD